MLFFKKKLNAEVMFENAYDFLNVKPSANSKVRRVKETKEKLFYTNFDSPVRATEAFHNWCAYNRVPSCSIYLTVNTFNKVFRTQSSEYFKVWAIECTVKDGTVYVFDRFLFNDVVPYSEWLETFRNEELYYEKNRKFVISTAETIKKNLYYPGAVVFADVIRTVEKNFPLVYDVIFDPELWDETFISGNIVKYSKYWVQNGFPIEMQYDLFNIIYGYVCERFIEEMIKACSNSQSNMNYSLTAGLNKKAMWKNFDLNSRSFQQ